MGCVRVATQRGWAGARILDIFRRCELGVGQRHRDRRGWQRVRRRHDPVDGPPHTESISSDGGRADGRVRRQAFGSRRSHVCDVSGWMGVGCRVENRGGRRRARSRGRAHALHQLSDRERISTKARRRLFGCVRHHAERSGHGTRVLHVSRRQRSGGRLEPESRARGRRLAVGRNGGHRHDEIDRFSDTRCDAIEACRRQHRRVRREVRRRRLPRVFDVSGRKRR